MGVSLLKGIIYNRNFLSLLHEECPTCTSGFSQPQTECRQSCRCLESYRHFVSKLCTRGCHSRPYKRSRTCVQRGVHNQQQHASQAGAELPRQAPLTIDTCPSETLQHPWTPTAHLFTALHLYVSRPAAKSTLKVLPVEKTTDPDVETHIHEEEPDLRPKDLKLGCKSPSTISN